MYNTANFFAILPSAVRYNPNLTPRSILLYAVLTSLAASDGEAYASNAYLMSALGTSERTVMRLLRELVDNDYIAIRYEYKDGTKEIARRLIRIKELPLLLDAPKTQALYAVIPSHILAVPTLSVQAKLLYAEISAATPTDGFCSKPATFFAYLLHTSEVTIQRYMRELIRVDAIRAEMEYKGETKEIRRRRIYLTAAADIAEKRAELAADGSESPQSDNEPNEPNAADTHKSGHILGGVIFDTTYGNAAISSHPLKKRKIRHGKRRRNTEKLRL